MLGLEAENFTGVLTSFMRPQAECSTSVTILRAITIYNSEYKVDTTDGNQINSLHTMFVMKSCLNIVDRRVGHTTAIKNIQPLLCRFCLCDLLNHSLKNVPVLHAKIVR